MAGTTKTPDQKRIDKLEELTKKLIKSNQQLEKQIAVQSRELRRIGSKSNSLESKIRELISKIKI